MNSSPSPKQLLLPLYHVRKQTRRLSEKKLIVILLSITVTSLYFILGHLPSNVNIADNDKLNEVFVPKYVNESKLIHNVDDQRHVHEFKNIKTVRPTRKKKPIVPQDPKKASTDLEENTKRRDKVKEMTMHAWNSYKKYAWGQNELRPLSKSGHGPGIFGAASNLGASIVDAIDTLFIMGYDEEVATAKKWIKENFNFKQNTQMSAFEVNIRFVGGFLSMYSLTNDKFYLDKAEEVAKSFLSVFNTPTGIPYSLFNPTNNVVRNYNWASGSCSILAEIGTFALEFQYLSDATGNSEYIEKINKIYKALDNANKESGLYFNYINPSTGSWCSKHASIGGLADSFYEYLLKHWLLKQKKDDKLIKTYLDAIKAIRGTMVRKSMTNLTYIGDYIHGSVQNRMGHLACFSGGLFALTYMNRPGDAEWQEYKDLAAEITHTCHESYLKMPTGLGPEAFGFDSPNEPTAVDRYYILRPEVVESYFYLWRMTKDQKYRDWAWEAVQALEKHCRTPDGYSGIRDVSSPNPGQDDVQQSFFFAETLKYLFLIFSDDDVMPLDKYVFNTEAHPFLIKKSE